MRTDADGPALPGSPVSVEVAVYDFLTTIGPSVLVERQPVQVFITAHHYDEGAPTVIVLGLDGVRDLIEALTEVVEAVEEGQR